MSTDAYLRASAREIKFWPQFLYSFSFDANQISDRNTIYGLYSGSYLNQQKYLTEIETIDLLNLLNDYNVKIAELTTEQQVVVTEIVSKRYLAGVDKAIHDQKMVTKSKEIDAENLAWDAKFIALTVDQSALATMADKVSVETQKISAKIIELEAYIDIEGFNLSEVDIQILEKEIQSSKVDIEILNATNEVIKIQVEIVNAAIKLVETDLQIAKTKIEIADVNKNIVRIDLLENDLIIEQEKTIIAQAELPIAELRVELADAKSAELDKELIYTDVTLMNQTKTNYDNKVDLMDYKEVVKEDDLSIYQQEKELEMSNRLAVANLEITFANADSAQEILIDKQRIGVMEQRVIDVRAKVDAAVEVAQTLAAANIATTLTHTIQKKIT